MCIGVFVDFNGVCERYNHTDESLCVCMLVGIFIHFVHDSHTQPKRACRVCICTFAITHTCTRSMYSYHFAHFAVTRHDAKSVVRGDVRWAW